MGEYTKRRGRIRTRRQGKYKGGVDTVFVCPSRKNPKLRYKEDLDRCITEFEDQTGYTFIDVEPDGNCFFHTLELYYQLANPGQPTPNYQELRAIVVQHMIDHYDKYHYNYGVPIEDILDLSEDGEWDNDAGDLVVAAAADALRIQLKVYDLQLGTRKPLTKKRIVLYTHPEVGNIPKQTATLMRINQGHYGLLQKLNENILLNSMMSLQIKNNKNKNKNNRNKNKTQKNKSFHNLSN
jgi:hypothetical protein